MPSVNGLKLHAWLMLSAPMPSVNGLKLHAWLMLAFRYLLCVKRYKTIVNGLTLHVRACIFLYVGEMLQDYDL